MERCPSNIPGMDEMLGGGFPLGRSVVVCGGPGCGKSTFCAQFLYEGIRQSNEPAVLVLLEESYWDVSDAMKTVGFDLDPLVRDEKLWVIDISPYETKSVDEYIYRAEELRIGSFKTDDLVERIAAIRQEVDFTRMVVDSLSALKLQFTDDSVFRREVLQFMKFLGSLNATTLFTSEMYTTIKSDMFIPEQFLADGVIALHNFRRGNERIRALEILKMRSVKQDPGLRPFTIEDGGIMVYPEEQVFGSPEESI